MTRICFVGAGSVVFTTQLLRDLLSYDDLGELHIALHDIDADRLETARLTAEQVARRLGRPVGLSAHTDRRAALEGVDVAITMIQVGGLAATKIDFEVPARFGLRQTIGDTLGVGGVYRALRTFPVLRDIAADMAAGWGQWNTRREEFYVRCAHEVDAVTWRTVERMFEPRLKDKLATCRAALARMTDDSIPARLRLGKFEVLGRDEEVTRVSTHSRFDPQDLPTPLAQRLPAFDGRRPTDEVVAQIEREIGVTADSGILRRLVDFGLLESDPGDAPA